MECFMLKWIGNPKTCCTHLGSMLCCLSLTSQSVSQCCDRLPTYVANRSMAGGGGCHGCMILWLSERVWSVIGLPGFGCLCDFPQELSACECMLFCIFKRFEC